MEVQVLSPAPFNKIEGLIHPLFLLIAISPELKSEMVDQPFQQDEDEDMLLSVKIFVIIFMVILIISGVYLSLDIIDPVIPAPSHSFFTQACLIDLPQDQDQYCQPQ